MKITGGGMTKKQVEKFIFENQINAIVRTIALIGKDKNLTINDITHALAKAEKKAEFLCGFVMLNGAEDVKKKILNYLINNGFVTTDNGSHLNLTATGLKRSKKELPPEIERYL